MLDPFYSILESMYAGNAKAAITCSIEDRGRTHKEDQRARPPLGSKRSCGDRRLTKPLLINPRMISKQDKTL
mgnify:FL=1